MAEIRASGVCVPGDFVRGTHRYGVCDRLAGVHYDHGQRVQRRVQLQSRGGHRVLADPHARGELSVSEPIQKHAYRREY